MKTSILISIFIIICSFCMQTAIARSTAPINLAGNLSDAAVIDPLFQAVNSTINTDTGNLNSSFTPSFRMITINPFRRDLTLSVATNTSNSGYQNAVFNVGSTKYVIFTNSDVLPPVSSLTNIKNGTLNNNPNAIAYIANDPSDDTGNLTINYNSTNKNWDLRIAWLSVGRTTFTIPAGAPLGGSYTSDDETGSYQAIVTLSFNP